jgi:hypothetical protein
MPTTTRSAKTSNSTPTQDVPVTDSTPTPTAFKLLHQNVILYDVSRGTSAPQTCDVALLSDGRRMARFTRDHVWHYHSFPEDPRVASEFIAAGENGTTRFANGLENVRIRSQVRALQMTNLQADIAKFRSMFPALSDFQQLESHRPTPIFSTGEVFVGIGMPHGLVGLDAWNYVDRHASGDFGTRGKLLAAPLTDEETFCVGMLKGERSNAAAIQSGSGLVVSEFVLEEKWQVRYRDHFKISKDDITKPPGAALILTLLNGGIGKSLLKIIPAGSER